jgi:hypothetical protein
MSNDRDSVKEYILKLYKNKVKKEVLEKNIEGLIDEYFDTQKCILETGADVNELPTKKEMKWWFQDKVTDKDILSAKTSGDELIEVKIDDIYKSDLVLARAVFKRYYDWKWEYGVKIPPEILELVKMNRLMGTSKEEYNKKILLTRLINLAMLGALRLYKMERRPYLRMSDVNKIRNHFHMVLDVIYKVDNGFYGNNEIKGSVYLFDAFGLMSDTEQKETKIKKQRKPRTKKADTTNDRPDTTGTT